MIKRTQSSALLVCGISLVINQSLFGLSLQSALQEIIVTNPSIIAKQKELEAARHELTLAKSGYYPKIDVQGSYGYEESKSQLTNNEKKNWASWNTSATLTQNVFSGFSTLYDIKTKEFKIKARENALKEQANDSALTLAKSYLDLLKAYELLLIETNSVKSHEKIFKDIRQRTEGGSGRVSDFMEVSAKLSLSYVNLLSQENNYQDAQSNFHKALGRYEEGKNLVTPDEVKNVPANLSQALSEALKKNPSLLVSRYELEASKTAMRLERNAYMPKVDATLNSKISENANGMGGQNDSSSALLTLTWNLFKGGSDYARVERAVSEIENSTEKLHALQREVLEGMGLSYNAYTSLNKQKDFLIMYEESNLHKKGYYQQEFDLGRRSLMDLLDSEDEYNTARRKLIQNRYDLLYSQYRILDAKGEFLTYFNIEVTGNKQKTYKYDLDEVESEHPVVICQNSVDKQFNINGCQILPETQQYEFVDTKANLILNENNVSNNIILVDTNESMLSSKEEVNDKNIKKAFEWYQKGAEHGDSVSMKILSTMYQSGYGTEVDAKKALYWKSKSIKTGNIADKQQPLLTQACGSSSKFLEAQQMYEQTDMKLKAFHLFVDIAREGDPKAQFMLGRMYNRGIGVAEDKAKAAYWYQEAARQGYSPAYKIVWSFYRDGQNSFQKDDVKAEFWRQKLIKAGNIQTHEEMLVCAKASANPDVNVTKTVYSDVMEQGKKFDINGQWEEAEKIYEQEYLSGNGEAARKIADHYYSRQDAFLSKQTSVTPIPKGKKKSTERAISKPIKQDERMKSLEERLKDLGITLGNQSSLRNRMSIVKAPPPLINKSTNQNKE